MNNPIGQSHHHHGESAVTPTDQSGSSISNLGATADNQDKDLPVSHVGPDGGGKRQFITG